MSNTEKTVKPVSPGGFENIRLLIELVKPEAGFASLISSVSAQRKKLDGVLAAEHENLRKLEQARREKQQKADEELKVAQKTEETQKAAKAAPIQFLDTTASVEPTEETPAVIEKKHEKIVFVAPAGTEKTDPAKNRVFTPSYVKGKLTSPVQSPSTQDGRQRPGGGAFAPRPQGGRPFGDRSGGGGFAPKNPPPLSSGTGPSAASALLVNKERKGFGDKKKDYAKTGDDKKGMNRRTLIRKGFLTETVDEDRVGSRKLKNKKKQGPAFVAPIKIEKAVITTENLTVKILSEKIGKTAQEIIKQLMVLGIMTNINSVVDFPTMELVASELGVELELKLDKTQEQILVAGHDEQDDENDLVKRPPIITVMGHVDHGKTSLLDKIRKSAVVSGEAGGITQAIGAYSVQVRGEKITFLDTPGHEAFTEMRARGASVTDIAILVVAADDGIMPQTIEAINHAKAADVPVIVAINKIDKPGANIEKTKTRLTEFGLVPEEWQGDTIVVPISAKTGEGIEKLLDSILDLADALHYRANPKRLARGTVIEAMLDKGKGPVANIIVQNGTLKVGDTLVSGTAVGRVRAMTDDRGKAIKQAGPSTPVQVLGFTDVPGAGDPVLAVPDDKIARQVASERVAKEKTEKVTAGQKLSLDELLLKTGEVKLKDLNIIIKADVQGSAEALKNSLDKLMNDEARVKVIHSGVGAVNKSDIMLAEVSNSVIIGFNVRTDAETKQTAESLGIDIRTYRVIYDAIDEVTAMLNGMLTPKFRETVTGKAEVRNIFKITGSGIVAGSFVLSGKIYRNSKVRVYRDGEVVFEGALKGLKRFKDDVKEVAENYECGISVEGFSDIKENDVIEAYTLEQI